MINGKLLCVQYLLYHVITTTNEQSFARLTALRLESSIRLLLLKSLKLKVANLLKEQDKVVDTTNTELVDEQKSSLPKI